MTATTQKYGGAADKARVWLSHWPRLGALDAMGAGALALFQSLRKQSQKKITVNTKPIKDDGAAGV